MEKSPPTELDGGAITLTVYLAITIVFVGFFAYAVYAVLDGFWKVQEKQKTDYRAYQTGLDNQIRAQGHSEEYVGKERQIRALKAKRRDAKIGYYAAWIGGIICLFVFPPIGIFLTGFAIIMSIREGRKLRKEIHDTAYEIKAVRDNMPEK
jgi:hypothetical protein